MLQTRLLIGTSEWRVPKLDLVLLQLLLQFGLQVLLRHPGGAAGAGAVAADGAADGGDG